MKPEIGHPATRLGRVAHRCGFEVVKPRSMCYPEPRVQRTQPLGHRNIQLPSASRPEARHTPQPRITTSVRPSRSAICAFVPGQSLFARSWIFQPFQNTKAKPIEHSHSAHQAPRSADAPNKRGRHDQVSSR